MHPHVFVPSPPAFPPPGGGQPFPHGPPDLRVVAPQPSRPGRRLLESLSGWEKYDKHIQNNPSNFDGFISDHFYAFVDYLERYFRLGDSVYKYLYIGEKLKQLHDPALGPEQDLANRSRVTEADVEVLCGPIREELGDEAAGAVEALLCQVRRVVLAQGRRHLKVLWIGDCLYLDVRGFLAAMALEDGITFEPTFLTSKNPAQQLEELRRLSDRKFDLIGYSPFTYEFSVEIAGFHGPRRSMAGRREIDGIVAAEMGHVGKMLEVAATLFDAPCYVHNTANVRRHDSSPRQLAKVWLTCRVRRIARESVNGRLAERIAAWRGMDGNVILLDETGLLDRYGETALGRVVYPNFIQHPAELGRLLADHYREILATHADLVGKKVIVCDLDNTLWKGEIGEGAVEHDVGIQGTLKELRGKGVLLAINSKNDRATSGGTRRAGRGRLRRRGDQLGFQGDEHASHPAGPEPEAQGFRLHRRSCRSARAGPRGAAGSRVLDATSSGPGAAGHLGGRYRIIPRWIGRSSIASARAREPPGGGRGGRRGPGPGLLQAGDPRRDPRGQGGGAQARRRADQPHQPVQPGREPDQPEGAAGLAGLARVPRRRGRCPR